MNHDFEGSAIVYCQGAFTTPYGKTAHGLVRRSHRYRILSVIDASCAGRDADSILVGGASGIPVVASLDEACAAAAAAGLQPTHLIFGLAPDGGRLTGAQREDLLAAVHRGLHLVAGLHDFLSDDEAIVAAARQHGVTLTDVRKPPPRPELHGFSGKIEEVMSFKIAVLGTDSALGKRTTAWLVVDALKAAGRTVEMIGTGQTAWLQGARYSMVLDTLVNDFVAGELEHAAWTAWNEQRPDFLVVEGQGSLMNPAYPGGFEILAATRPDAVILQHAPGREDYDGFPGYPIQPIEQQIQAIELISGRPVIAITLNHEGLSPEEAGRAAEDLQARTGLPVCDPLRGSLAPVIERASELALARVGKLEGARL